VLFQRGCSHGSVKLDKPWRLSLDPIAGSRGASAGVEQGTVCLLVSSSLTASATAKMKALEQTGPQLS